MTRPPASDPAGDVPEDVEAATRFSLRSMARRYQVLSEEISALDAQLGRLVAETAPDLAHGGRHGPCRGVARRGRRDNPERLKSEASFASLCGVSPIEEASSGKVVRHRLNSGGNRDANRALHLICVVRMGHDRRTKEYVARRTAEGKSKREIIRCLKR